MHWEENYKKKIMSAHDAVSKIKSGDRVVVSVGVAEPTELIKAMVCNKDSYNNVEIVQMLPLGKVEYINDEMAGHFHLNSLFVGAPIRDAISDGRADFTPCFFYQIPDLFRNGYLKVDVALIQISPPDNHGYCNFGVSVDYIRSAVESAKLVIAQVNDRMPRTMGDTSIHINEIDCIVLSSLPIAQITPPKITDVEKAIGENCASLIEDGSTLQLGIGAIPDAVLLFLKDKKDLGIHSEMISDGVVDLVEAGVITNKKKTLHRGKIVVTFLMGTQRLYDFADGNPLIEVYPVDYVNNPTVIMKNYKMVSINSCLQVDLMGQVSSESIGLKQFSGVGGQIDFVRGVSMTEGGKSIIAIPSTASHGKISRIVPLLDEGTAVTTSRNDVQFIVTEYGIAELKGKSLRDRAKALINIAHPDFKPQLVREWESRFNSNF